jgi:hypothetical protein
MVLPFAPMKSGLIPRMLLVVLACASPGRGQPPAGTPAPLYTADQLDQLLGPIALYPDPLVALILPASTAPGDIVAAAGFVAAKGDPYDAGSQPWSESVKALAHYPEAVEWLAQNLTWVQAVGAAFATEPAGVMDSIQRLRVRALNLGTLVTTPQQQVVEEDGLIEIQPGDSDVIYVPRYDPSVVYLEAREVDAAPLISFGEPYHAGLWLDYGFDWRRQALFVGRFSRDGQGWQRPNFFSPNGHSWPPPGRPAFVPVPAVRPGEPFARPSLLSGAPPSPRFVRDRRLDFPQRPGLSPGASNVGQRQAFPGQVPGAGPGSPAAAEWQREREQREREGRDRTQPREGAVPAPARPPANPLKPPAPSPPPANSEQDPNRDKH